MLAGVAVATLSAPRERWQIASRFFEGAGYGFTNIISLIVAAFVVEPAKQEGVRFWSWLKGKVVRLFRKPEPDGEVEKAGAANAKIEAGKPAETEKPGEVVLAAQPSGKIT